MSKKGSKQTEIILFLNEGENTITKIGDQIHGKALNPKPVTDKRKERFSEKQAEKVKYHNKTNLAVNQLVKKDFIINIVSGQQTPKGKQRFQEALYELNYKGIFEYMSSKFLKANFDELHSVKIGKKTVKKDSKLLKMFENEVISLGIFFSNFLKSVYHNNKKNIDFTLDELFEAFILAIGRMKDFDTTNSLNKFPKSSKQLTEGFPLNFCRKCANYYLYKASNIIFQKSVGDQSDFKYMGLNKSWWKND